MGNLSVQPNISPTVSLSSQLLGDSTTAQAPSAKVTPAQSAEKPKQTDTVTKQSTSSKPEETFQATLEYDKQIRQIVFKLTDRAGQVVRQIPPESIRDMVAKIQEQTEAPVIDSKG